jgi:hypothetical protein
MPEKAFDGGIAFGPGGRILENDGRNEELLARLRETPPLRSEALLKLAVFYNAFPTNASLGDHLALLALSDDRVPQQTLFANHARAGFALEDLFDAFGAATPEGSGRHEARERGARIRLSVRQVPVSGIGLLIETLDFQDEKPDEQVRFHFVIGVSPDIDRLPSPE